MNEEFKLLGKLKENVKGGFGRGGGSVEGGSGRM